MLGGAADFGPSKLSALPQPMATRRNAARDRKKRDAPGSKKAPGYECRLSGGRGSRIRTCDLEYPKLPRYQAALYPARVPSARALIRDAEETMFSHRYTFPP